MRENNKIDIMRCVDALHKCTNQREVMRYQALENKSSNLVFGVKIDKNALHCTSQAVILGHLLNPTRLMPIDFDRTLLTESLRLRLDSRELRNLLKTSPSHRTFPFDLRACVYTYKWPVKNKSNVDLGCPGLCRWLRVRMGSLEGVQTNVIFIVEGRV